MQMKWLVVLDPIDGLLSKTDTSLAVINKAREKNIEVDTATIEQLYFEEHAGVLSTAADGSNRSTALGNYDLIFMRKEPPYDLRFHYATHLLSLSGTLVLNSPSALRDFNEKLIVLPFVKHMPPTLVGSDRDVIADFVSRHGRAVIKSLDSFQGKSVKKITSTEQELLQQYTQGGTQPVMLQQFSDRVYEGDKRVIMLGHTFLGAAMRRRGQDQNRGQHCHVDSLLAHDRTSKSAAARTRRGRRGAGGGDPRRHRPQAQEPRLQRRPVEGGHPDYVVTRGLARAALRRSAAGGAKSASTILNYSRR